MKFAIYHRDREFARVAGDPQLGTVQARTKEEAEAKASHLSEGAGVWAVALPTPVFDEADCGGVFDGFTVASDADPGL